MGNIGNWLWNHIAVLWEKAPAVVTSTRMTQAGQVAAGPHKLYWVVSNPSTGNSLWEVSDDTTGLTATVLDYFSALRVPISMLLNPPMNFTTGIYLKTFTNMTSVVFGYI